MSKIAKRDGISRHPQFTRDELVDFIVRFLLGDDLDHEKRAAITRVGCRTKAPGLRTLDRIDPIMAAEVRRRLSVELASFTQSADVEARAASRRSRVLS